MDIYQKRYIAHQTRKGKVLAKILRDRHSTRQFGDKDIDVIWLGEQLDETIDSCPSSCDRKAVYLDMIGPISDYNFLSGLLVGGIGWMHRARAIVLIKADKRAYKENLDYMPYLDAGVVIQTLYLYLTSNNYKCCYVNPNIREKYQKIFRDYFQFEDYEIFCGAMAIGYEK